MFAYCIQLLCFRIVCSYCVRSLYAAVVFDHCMQLLCLIIVCSCCVYSFILFSFDFANFRTVICMHKQRACIHVLSLIIYSTYDGYSSELFIEVGIRMMFALMHENT